VHCFQIHWRPTWFSLAKIIFPCLEPFHSCAHELLNPLADRHKVLQFGFSLVEPGGTSTIGSFCSSGNVFFLSFPVHDLILFSLRIVQNY